MGLRVLAAVLTTIGPSRLFSEEVDVVNEPNASKDVAPPEDPPDRSATAGETTETTSQPKPDTAVEGPRAPNPGGQKESTSENAPPPRKRVLTLSDCLKLALANSKKIEAEKQRLEMLRAKQDQLWWVPFSNLMVEGAFSMVPEKCADITDGTVRSCDDPASGIPADDDFFEKKWGPTLHIKLKGLVPIPTSNRYSKAKEALREAEKAKRAMLPTIKHQIAYDVHRAYHGIIGAREMRFTLSQGRKHLEKAKKKVESNLEKQEGTDTSIDLLKLKVFESRLDAMEQQVIQIEKTALAAMNFLVGAENDAPIDLPDEPQEIIERELAPLNDYKEIALKRRPEFEALRHGIKALKAKVKIMRGELAPEVGIRFTVQAGYTPRVRVIDRNKEGDDKEVRPGFLYKNSYNYGNIIPSVALVMRMPLDFGITYHKVREAKVELAATLKDKAYAMEGILLEVETTYIEVTSIREAITALSKSKKIAKGWLNAAAQNHAIGLGSSKELKDALKEYFTIMADLLQKIGEYNIALAKLDKVVGVLLDDPAADNPAILDMPLGPDLE